MANSFPPASGGRPGSYQRRNVDPFAAIRRNHRIKVPQVRLISPEGKQLGIIDTTKAINLALENGLDLVAAICEKRPGIRIVVLTGYASIATAVEAIKLGAHHYLTKPTDVTTLLAAFEHQTSGEGHATPPEEPTSLERMEWETIQQVMLDVDGNVTLAAARLGLHRRTLQRKLKKRPAGMQ